MITKLDILNFFKDNYEHDYDNITVDLIENSIVSITVSMNEITLFDYELDLLENECLDILKAKMELQLCKII